MNYYERHIGDYIRDTVGLSMLEDGAYGRLLDQLYQTEKPLPLDRKEVYRMARATSTAERKAVDYVMSKFFEKGDDGFIQKRAMETLAEYWDRPEKAEKNTKEGNKERQRKSRERRKAMFEALAGHGVVPPYNTPMKELEALLSRYQSRPVTPEKRDMSRYVTESVMAPVMGTHSPLTTNQEPKDIKHLSGKPDESHPPVDDPPPRERKTDADPVFVEAWAAYPKREGGNPRASALKAWKARVRAGELPEAMLAGVRRYAAFCQAQGNVGSRFVKQASTFFGPDRHFAEPWGAAGQGNVAGASPAAAAGELDWWVRAGFEKHWEASLAGVTEGNAHLWRRGRPVRAIQGVQVEPWPEGEVPA